MMGPASPVRPAGQVSLVGNPGQNRLQRHMMIGDKPAKQRSNPPGRDEAMVRKQTSSGVKSLKSTATTPTRQGARPRQAGTVRIYKLEVVLLSGPITQRFAQQNPVVSRTLQIRADQTLQDLHQAIFEAFGREEEHGYEFQLGKGPMDPEGPRYVLPGAYDVAVADGAPAAGRVDQATIGSLGLEVGRRFAYWFDFG